MTTNKDIEIVRSALYRYSNRLARAEAYAPREETNSYADYVAMMEALTRIESALAERESQPPKGEKE